MCKQVKYFNSQSDKCFITLDQPPDNTRTTKGELFNPTSVGIGTSPKLFKPQKNFDNTLTLKKKKKLLTVLACMTVHVGYRVSSNVKRSMSTVFYCTSLALLLLNAAIYSWM